MAAVSMKNVAFAYGVGPDRQPVFDALTLDIPTGGVVALLGPSGSGKTTLLKLVGGLLAPAKGVMELGIGMDGTGYVPQESSLLPWLSVDRNAGLAAELRGARIDPRLADRLLDAFGLSGSRRRLPRTLSGGMKQRLAVASALTSGATLLLLDEPFSGTDALRRQAMYAALGDFTGSDASAARTIIFTTHDLADVFALQATALCLRDGDGDVPCIVPAKGWDAQERARLLDVLTGA